MSGLVLIGESDMTIRKMTDVELLVLLLGKSRAKALYEGSLVLLFQPDAGEDAVEPKLQAAHELVRRWLEESLCRSSALENPAAMRTLLSTLIRHKQYESFTVLFLDTRHRLIVVEEMFRGSIDSATVHPREIVRRALQVNAAAIVLAHNHPSGIAEPSAADNAITRRIVDAMALVDVRVLDHFVVGDMVVSLAELGMM
jgi:DNA repair protein RadC